MIVIYRLLITRNTDLSYFILQKDNTIEKQKRGPPKFRFDDLATYILWLHLHVHVHAQKHK